LRGINGVASTLYGYLLRHGSGTTKEIVARTGRSSTVVSTNIAAMVKRGYVARTAVDRRSYRFALTPDGVNRARRYVMTEASA
jgi:DNA-binding MarR family transcriptional regulator